MHRIPAPKGAVTLSQVNFLAALHRLKPIPQEADLFHRISHSGRAPRYSTSWKRGHRAAIQNRSPSVALPGDAYPFGPERSPK